MAQKRPFQGGDDSNENAPEEKRQRNNLQSVVMEAMKVNSIQKFWTVLEPLIRRVVNEEVERALTKLLPSKLGLRPPPKQQLQGPDSRNLRLQFQNKLALPLFTGSKVEGEQGNAILVVLLDAITGQVVSTGDEASARLDIVVLEGDFTVNDEENWTQEEFENHEVKEREGKRPLLTGELAVTLKEGVGTIGELIFTDNSSWIRSRKFRLGVKVSPGCLHGPRIREAKTEAFNVKDHRGELYKKHYPPALNDEVWRLEKIGKDGAYHKRLHKENIHTVEHFLIMYSTGPQKLRDIFGNTMSTKIWDSIMEHAKTCVLNEIRRVYYPDESHNIGVIFNTIYQPLGIVRNGGYVPSSLLSETEQVYMERLVQEAHNDLSTIIDFSVRTGPQDPEGVTGNRSRDSTDNQVFQQAHNLQAASSQRDATGRLFSAGEYTRSVYDQRPPAALRYRGQAQQLPEQRIMTNTHASAAQSIQLTPGFTHNVMLSDVISPTVALGNPQPSYNYAYPPESLERVVISNGYYRQRDIIHSGQDGFFHNQVTELSSDEDSQGKGYGMWENEEMQLMHVLNAGTGDQSLGLYSNSTMQGDMGYHLANLPSSRNFSEGRRRLHGRAYMGWIKLKAALKWGFVYKKKVAARQQARIQELED